MSNEILFKQIERELRQYKHFLTRAADSVLDQEISNYPIFIIHKGELELGIPVVDKVKMGGSWSINLSTLEEFAARKLIQSERVENFREVYKDAKRKLCLFVLSEAGANFIFVSRPDKDPAINN